MSSFLGFKLFKHNDAIAICYCINIVQRRLWLQLIAKVTWNSPCRLSHLADSDFIRISDLTVEVAGALSSEDLTIATAEDHRGFDMTVFQEQYGMLKDLKKSKSKSQGLSMLVDT